MGLSLEKFSSYFSKQRGEARILMLGLDAAGKTTILYTSKLGKCVTTIPTIGFNVETLPYGNLNLTAWDVGGRDRGRVLWRHYYQNTQGIVFVVDSNDRERLQEVRDELHHMAGEEELKGLPILVFANKQDLPNVLTIDVLEEKLELSKLDEMNVKWHVQPSVGTKGEGIHEGFEWLANTIQSKTDLTQPIVETINDSKLMKKDILYFWKSVNLKTVLSKFI